MSAPAADAGASRRGVGAVLVVALCALLCALPVVGGLVAGTVVDRVLDSPSWMTVLVAAIAGAAVLVIMRRRPRRSRGC